MTSRSRLPMASSSAYSDRPAAAKHRSSTSWRDSSSRPLVRLWSTVARSRAPAHRVSLMTAGPGKLLEEQRIGAPRPRDLDDVLVARVVSDIHASLMREVDKDVAREMGDR